MWYDSKMLSPVIYARTCGKIQNPTLEVLRANEGGKLRCHVVGRLK